jgi:hypothetical protein
VKTARAASDRDLRSRAFQPTRVTATALNIAHAPLGRGPFCRLHIEGNPAAGPGVYAWVVNDQVQYVGRANDLRQIVHGARMSRANNDYTYVPLSKQGQMSSPRVRINGLLNRALVGRATVQWWWLSTGSSGASKALEAPLIDLWTPPWNRARPPLVVGPPGRPSQGSPYRSSWTSWLRRLLGRER